MQDIMYLAAPGIRPLGALRGSLGSLTKCGDTCGIPTRRIAVLDLALLPDIIRVSITIEIMGGARRQASQGQDHMHSGYHSSEPASTSITSLSCINDSAVYGYFQPSLYGRAIASYSRSCLFFIMSLLSSVLPASSLKKLVAEVGTMCIRIAQSLDTGFRS
ncbi:hypothetical protein BDR03DRAFT_73 [Suillus americanus]|nr:hypothetical protein BDR03DRAFT_73 [Suillus americanus]